MAHLKSEVSGWKLLVCGILFACSNCQLIFALDRIIFDCGTPFTDSDCSVNRYWAPYNYYFGRSEGMPPRGPSPHIPPFRGSTDVDLLYDLAPSVHQYYVDRFNRNGVNGFGGTGDGINFALGKFVLLAHIDHSEAGESICTDGSGASAHQAFCAGSTNLDVVGHEMLHILAGPYINSNPETRTEGETGALEESIADFFGEAFERYVTGSYDWLATSGPDDIIVRDMANPGSVSYEDDDGILIPFPDRYRSAHYYTGDEDYGGVHRNSTVLSKAAYLAVEGGSFNGYDISGIGFDKVEQIWYRAITTYFQPGVTFNDAYVHIIQAASDLYGEHEVDEVTRSLQAVELHLSRIIQHGDYDQDGDVDGRDFLDWQRQFGSMVTAFSGADGNGNGIVDAADYTIWRDNYGTGGTLVIADAIPEPASGVILAAAFACAVVARRHSGQRSTTSDGKQQV